MNRRRSALVAGGVALAGALALTGCSSNSSSSSSTTTSSSSTTSSSAAPTSTTASGPALCQPSQLQFSIGSSNGAAGTIESGLTLKNISTTTCQLDGYPGMQLFDANGNALPTNVVRGGGPQLMPAIANSPPTVVVLGPQQQAGFSLSYSDVPVGSQTSCPTSAKARVTPPNDTAFAEVALKIGPCGGGTIHVSPIYPGAAP
jgi:hypothetical protein